MCSDSFVALLAASFICSSSSFLISVWLCVPYPVTFSPSTFSACLLIAFFLPRLVSLIYVTFITFFFTSPKAFDAPFLLFFSGHQLPAELFFHVPILIFIILV